MNAPRRFNGLLWAGLLGTLILGGNLVANLVALYRGDSGHNWTHREMRLTLPETRDAVELYIGGELLQKHLDRKGLTSAGPDGTPYVILERDIRVRLNHWPEQRVSLAMQAIPEAFLAGIFIACLALGLYQVRQQRKQNS